MNESILISASMVLMVATACQWLAWRVKLPGIVLLLITGILAGMNRPPVDCSRGHICPVCGGSEQEAACVFS